MADVERLVAAVSSSGTAKTAKDLVLVSKAAKDAAEDRTGTIKIKVDDKEVRPALAKKKALARNETAHVRIKTHDSDLTRTKAKAEALDTKLVGIQGFGAKIRGLKFGGQGLGLALGLPAAFSAVTPLVGGINSLAAGAVALVAPLRQSTAIIGAMPALIAPAAAAFGAFKLATQGVGDAISETVKAQDELAKAMRSGDTEAITEAKDKIDQLAESMEGKFHSSTLTFISDVAMMKVEFEELGLSLQPNLFRGVNEGLRGVRDMIRSITPELGLVAGALGGAAGDLGRQLGSAQFTDKLRTTLQGTAPLVGTLTSAIGSVLDSFVTLGATAQPVLARIEGTLMRLVGAMGNWADAMTDAKLDESYETWQKFWQILSNTWAALGNTLKAFKPLGDWLWDELNSLTRQWERWSDSIRGQNAMKEWAEDSKPVLEELGKFLADFSSMWARVADESGMASVIETLRTKFLPVLEDIIVASGETGTLDKLAGAIGGLLTIISTTMGTSGVMGMFLESIISITNALANLVEAFPALGTVIANFTTSLGLLKIVGVGGPVALGLAFFATTIIRLTGSLKVLTPLIYGLAVAFGVIKIGKMLGDMTAFVQLAAGVRSMGDAGALMGASFGKAQTKIGQALTSLGGLSFATVAVTGAITAGLLVWQAWQTNVKRTREEIERLVATMNDGTVVSDAFDDYVADLLATRQGWSEAASVMGMSANQIADAVKATSGEFDKARDASDGFAASSIGAADVAKWVGLSATIVGIPLAYAMAWDAATNDISRYFKELEEGSYSEVTRNFGRRMSILLESGDLSKMQAEQLRDTMAEADLAYKKLDATLNADADAFRNHAAEMSRSDAQALVSAQRTAEQTGNLDELQLQVSKLVAKYPDLAEALGVVTEEGLGAQAMFEAQTEAMNEAKARLDDYYNGLERIASQRDLIKTNDDLLGKMRDVNEALRENKGQWDANTDAGQAHRDAVRDLYEMFLSQGEAILDAGGSVDEAKGKYGDFMATLEDLKKDGLLPANTSAQELAESLGLVEGVYRAEIDLSWKDDAYQQLQLLEALAGGPGGDNATEVHQIAVRALMTGDMEAFDAAYAAGQWIASDPEGTIGYGFAQRGGDLETIIRDMARAGLSQGQTPEEVAWYMGVGMNIEPPDGYPTLLAYIQSQLVPQNPVRVPNTFVPDKEYLEPGDFGFTGPVRFPGVLEPQQEGQTFLQPGDFGFTGPVQIPVVPEFDIGTDLDNTILGPLFSDNYTVPAELDITPPSQEEFDRQTAGRTIHASASVDFEAANTAVNGWVPPIPDEKLKPRVQFDHANRVVNDWRIPIPDNKLKPRVSFEVAENMISLWEPPTVTLELEAAGLADAIREQIDGLPKYTIDIEGKVTPAAQGGLFGLFSNAEGSLPNQAKIQAPRPNLIQWAEPETHGEAFIPLAPSKRGRSLAIWAETGRRLGAMAAGGFTQAADGMISEKVYAKLRPDFSEMDWGGAGNPAFLTGGTGATWERIIAYLASTGIPYRVTSTVRPGATTRGSGNRRASLHASGRAVDFAPPGGGRSNAGLLSIYRAFLPIRNMLRELIYSGPGGSSPRNPITRADHYDHVHVGMADGGITPFAQGGLVTKPTLGLLGEAGPELVLPLASGGITTTPLRNEELLDVFSTTKVNAMVGELKKIMTATGQWTNFVLDLRRRDPAGAMKKVQSTYGNAQRFFDAQASPQQMMTNLNVIRPANGGFGSEHIWAQIHESITNQWNDRIATLTETDPHRAIRDIQTRMFASGVKKWSNEWMSMTSQIQAIQTRLSQEQARKLQNKWEWEFEHAETTRQVTMAKQAASTMEKWSDEWVAMMRRVEEAEARNTGPAVIINEATFNDDADIDAFNRGVEWAVRTSRL